MAKRNQFVDDNGKVYVEKKKGGCLKWLLIPILLFVILAVVGALNMPSNENTNTTSSEKTNNVTENNNKPATKEPEIKVTSTEIIDTFQANELKGKETYTGKLAEITGTIGDVGETFGSTYITLETDSDPYSIISLQCFFSDENKEGLSDLSKGDTVTLVGTIGEQSINVEVKDCKLK